MLLVGEGEDSNIFWSCMNVYECIMYLTQHILLRYIIVYVIWDMSYDIRDIWYEKYDIL